MLHKSGFLSLIFKHCLQIISLFSLEARERVLEAIDSYQPCEDHSGESHLLLPSLETTILMLLPHRVEMSGASS